jgi:hypothetical protein
MTCQPTCRIQRSTDLDPHDFAHGIVEGAFSLIFPDPQARLRLGLRAISRAGHGGMAWYVWTAERTGAYEIALVPDFPADAAGGAVLALRYFPDPDEPAFQDFSTVEQAVRRSSLFDRTGTPAFDQADALDPALFCIGSLVLVPQGEERFTLRLHVPDRWIEETPDGEGATDRRDVAAAELALPIVDALVGGVVYLGRGTRVGADLAAPRHGAARRCRRPRGAAGRSRGHRVGDRVVGVGDAGPVTGVRSRVRRQATGRAALVRARLGDAPGNRTVAGERAVVAGRALALRSGRHVLRPLRGGRGRWARSHPYPSLRGRTP